MQKFLNKLWEFIGRKKDKDNFVQKALKVCKVFKVKPLKTSKPDVQSRKTVYNLFCKEHSKDQNRVAGRSCLQGKCNHIKRMEEVKSQ